MNTQQKTTKTEGLSWESNGQRTFPVAFAMMEKVTKPAFRQEVGGTLMGGF